MSKHFAKGFLMEMPSGQLVHPCRLICRDGTLMWKHATDNPPFFEDQEQNIINTAKRLEELNTWVSSGLEPWQSLVIKSWYDPLDKEHSTGCRVNFRHHVHTVEYLYDELKNHLQPGETLTQMERALYYTREPG